MKLQRNNKFKGKIARGISTLLLTSMLLSGCSTAVSAETVENPTTIPDAVEHTIEETTYSNTGKFPSNYYLNYYKIDNEEVEKRYSVFDIKYPNALWSLNYLSTVLVKDSNDDYKVIQAFIYINTSNKKIEVYDLSTEVELFEFPYDDLNSDLTINNSGLFYNAKIDKATNKAPYFDNAEIVGFGSLGYEILFLNDIIEEQREKDGISYILYLPEVYNQVYTDNMDFTNNFKTTQELLKDYVKYVPIEHQLNSKELGLKPTYPAERKFFDSYKISDEQIDSRISKLNIHDKNEKISMGSVYTLVLKDSDDDYKLLSVISSNEGEDKKEFYDLYTKEYLFTLKCKKDFDYDIDSGLFKNIDFSKLIDPIDYFNDKKICYMADCREVNYFSIRNIDELSKEDGITYKMPCSPILYILFPTGSYYIEEQFYTVEQYARNYVTLPEDMIVTAKELGFENDKVKE